MRYGVKAIRRYGDSAIQGNICSIALYSNIKLRFIKFTFIKRALKMVAYNKSKCKIFHDCHMTHIPALSPSCSIALSPEPEMQTMTTPRAKGDVRYVSNLQPIKGVFLNPGKIWKVQLTRYFFFEKFEQKYQ